MKRLVGWGAGPALALLLLAACGNDDDGGTASEDTSSESTSEESGEGAASNACPPEGCDVQIVEVVPDGSELLVTWSANFEPDISRNHIHVYWDTFSADQVSSDAEANGFEQGDWSPTDAFPTYTTESAVSVANREGSTTLCVTAADRDHAVLDSSIVHCMDVGEQLE